MKLLIVIDMQNDFIYGTLGSKEKQNIINNVENKIKEYKDDIIYFTRDTHNIDYLHTQEGYKLPIEHCIKDTPGWCIIDEINKYSQSARVLDKKSFGYDWTTLKGGLSHFETIEIIGVCTDICVISNALILKSLLPEKIIQIDASCCAGTTPEMHQKALDIMKSCQIEVINENI